jgi:hypothetical protein
LAEAVGVRQRDAVAGRVQRFRLVEPDERAADEAAAGTDGWRVEFALRRGRFKSGSGDEKVWSTKGTPRALVADFTDDG